MITKLRDDWTDWHKRFKVALDAHKGRTGETDADIAVDAETSRGSITHWKVGRRTPQLHNFFLACKAVGADPAYVLFGNSYAAANDIAARISRLPPELIESVLTSLDGAEMRAARDQKPKPHKGKAA